MIEGTKAALKAQVTPTAKGYGRMGRAATAAVLGLTTVVTAAEAARGAPIPWAELPGVLGPVPVLTLAGTVIAAWWTTDRAAPEEGKT